MDSEFIDVKNQLITLLDSRGALAQLKAALRAQVFCAIQNQQLPELANSYVPLEGDDLHTLSFVMQWLKEKRLLQTLSVLETETKTTSSQLPPPKNMGFSSHAPQHTHSSVESMPLHESAKQHEELVPDSRAVNMDLDVHEEPYPSQITAHVTRVPQIEEPDHSLSDNPDPMAPTVTLGEEASPGGYGDDAGYDYDFEDEDEDDTAVKAIIEDTAAVVEPQVFKPQVFKPASSVKQQHSASPEKKKKDEEEHPDSWHLASLDSGAAGFGGGSFDELEISGDMDLSNLSDMLGEEEPVSPVSPGVDQHLGLEDRWEEPPPRKATPVRDPPPSIWSPPAGRPTKVPSNSEEELPLPISPPGEEKEDDDDLLHTEPLKDEASDDTTRLLSMDTREGGDGDGDSLLPSTLLPASGNTGLDLDTGLDDMDDMGFSSLGDISLGDDMELSDLSDLLGDVEDEPLYKPSPQRAAPSHKKPEEPKEASVPPHTSSPVRLREEPKTDMWNSPARPSTGPSSVFSSSVAPARPQVGDNSLIGVSDSDEPLGDPTNLLGDSLDAEEAGEIPAASAAGVTSRPSDLIGGGKRGGLYDEDPDYGMFDPDDPTRIPSNKEIEDMMEELGDIDISLDDMDLSNISDFDL
eukprot:gnl/Dysnectes_brevis/3514_a4460_316.p1 GENE.gnl/Dysnectes_brevis/3514_a4460_316~~gnl/Dysnectes_brevis/3514_a4460_316.p1  ORF type:complete len:634 (+),score=218.98 gnl/Dysnectes_brevis/3514_a4460_316:380-2281(+)